MQGNGTDTDLIKKDQIVLESFLTLTDKVQCGNF